MNNLDAYYNKMTETKISKLIIMLGIPTTISMLITNIYNLVDTYFIGTLGETAQGSIGILFTLQSILQAIGFMLGHGSGTYVSKGLASKNLDEASKYVSTAFFISLGFGIVFLVFGLLLLEPMLLLLGSTDTILPYAMQYGFWVILSCPFFISSLILNNNLRYEGKATYAMIGLSLGAILNILGDFIFINICHLGVFGAGMSTAISQIISFLVLLYFYLTMAQSKLNFKYITLKSSLILNIVKTGFPSLIRQGLNSISSGILNNLAKPFGDSAITAMSIVNRYSSFVMCVGLGIGQGYQPVASYNYQVKKYNRVKKGLLFTIVFSTIFIGILSIITLIIPEHIIKIFQSETEVIKIGVVALRYSAVGLMFLPLSVAINMTYQSIRKPLLASILSLLRSGAVFIPVVLILNHINGLGGIQAAQGVSDIITGLISVFFIFYFFKSCPKEEPEKLDL